MFVQKQEAVDKNNDKKSKNPREDSPVKEIRDRTKDTPPR